LEIKPRKEPQGSYLSRLKLSGFVGYKYAKCIGKCDYCYTSGFVFVTEIVSVYYEAGHGFSKCGNEQCSWLLPIRRP